MDGRRGERAAGPHGDRVVRGVLPPRTAQSPSRRCHGSLRSRRILAQDGVAEALRRSRYYEKPSRARRRRAFEACRRVYCAEMARRIAFLARSSRQDPWPGC